MTTDLERNFHDTWLGLVQPVEGLVLSLPVLLEAGIARRHGPELQSRFFELTSIAELPELAVVASGRKGRTRARAEAEALGTRRVDDLPGVFEQLLDLPPELFDRGEALHADLFASVEEAQQVLRPSMALRREGWRSQTEQHHSQAQAAESGLAPAADTPAGRAGRDYLLLIWQLPEGLDLDQPERVTGEWDYPPVHKFDRLLRTCRVPIGLLTNDRVIRLMYCPHGEASSWLTFNVTEMAASSDRELLDAFVMLLDERRLFDGHGLSLLELLERSRSYQAEVTTKLVEQCFEAMQALLDGFIEANERDREPWLSQARADEDEDHFYRGLLTTLMRLVFLLFAEDRSLLPIEHPHYARHLSVLGLYQALREAADRNPDTMHARFGAWPRLLALFRAVHRGVDHEFPGLGRLHLPARHGHLFDPDRFPFLEGRTRSELSQDSVEARAGVRTPSVSDHTLLTVLDKLLIVGGERQSYRTLQVEQIGSVYEGMLGYHVEAAQGESVCLEPHGVWIGVPELLAQSPNQRQAWLEAQGMGRAISKTIAAAIGKVGADDEGSAHALAVLGKHSVRGRANVPGGRLVLQPGPERRRTSTHYTPATLTRPVVRRTLEPLFAVIGSEPSSAQLLELKICDPAMGSGAFLVEVVRLLGDQLVAAWTREGKLTEIAHAYDDPVMRARRMVAQTCVYGVDKNPMAVDLAKLSLWLVTLARELPFTFVDHCLREGDSLVGLDAAQFRGFHWRPDAHRDLFEGELYSTLARALDLRQQIAKLAQRDDPISFDERKRLLDEVDAQTERLRIVGDLVLAGFFAESKPKARETRRGTLLEQSSAWLLSDRTRPPAELERARQALHDQVGRPFHWLLEFPEVFFEQRPDPLDARRVNKTALMDAFIGNPPFAGKNNITASGGPNYLDWLKVLHAGSHGNADLSAHFFRRADTLLGSHGTIGLIATNTIGQGDTRSTGLQWLVNERGYRIYDAIRSMPWPQAGAAVTVSVVHMARGTPAALDLRPMIFDPDPKDSTQLVGRAATVINSRLRPKPERPDPLALGSNAGLSFQGSIVLGMGFVLTPEERETLVTKDPRNAERIFPYLGGEEVNTNPDQGFDRYVINFGQMELDEAERWPDLIAIVREKVKPERDKNKREVRKKYWWRFGETTPALFAAIAGLERIVVTSQVSKHVMFSFQPTGRILSQKTIIFPIECVSALVTLQSRPHVAWTWLLSSTMKSDMSYSPSDCFQNFPFPHSDPRTPIPELETLGERLYQTRAALMLATQKGLTKTYNLLKDPECHEPAFVSLRELHVELDRAVLRAYGWADIEVPPYTTPTDLAEQARLEAFEDEIIDRLFTLNTERAAAERKVGSDETKLPSERADQATIKMPWG